MGMISLAGRNDSSTLDGPLLHPISPPVPTSLAGTPVCHLWFASIVTTSKWSADRRQGGGTMGRVSNIVVADLFFDADELKVRNFYIERADTAPLVQISWDATSAPDGFVAVGPEAAYARAADLKPGYPQYYATPIVERGRDSYAWQWSNDHVDQIDRNNNQFVAIVLPPGYSASAIKPDVNAAKVTVEKRLALLWLRSRADPLFEATWTMRAAAGDMKAVARRLNQRATVQSATQKLDKASTEPADVRRGVATTGVQRIDVQPSVWVPGLFWLFAAVTIVVCVTWVEKHVSGAAFLAIAGVSLFAFLMIAVVILGHQGIIAKRDLSSLLKLGIKGCLKLITFKPLQAQHVPDEMTDKQSVQV